MTESRLVDLHDSGSLVAADVAALLPSAALAGAQVRSTAEQAAALSTFDRPRAFVVVGPTADVDAALLTALMGDGAQAPVVAATALPIWVGPLDIVVVLAGTVDDAVSAGAAAQALRRGARVVVRASADGPVADAAGAALLDPQVSVSESLAGPARLTLLASVAAAAGLYPRPDFAAAAEQLDAMAMACHPSTEFFVNPGLTLAEQLAAGTPLLIGTDPVADALAAHACRSLAGISGCAGSWLRSAQAAGSPPVLAAATGRAGGSADVFYDPYDEETDHGQQISTVLVVGPSESSPPPSLGRLPGSELLPPEAPAPFGSAAFGAGRSPLAAALEAALPRAMCIGPEELPTSVTEGRESGDDVADVQQRDAFTWTVAMLSRIDFAAAYLALVTGARPPIDSPDGLGRPGRAAQHLPPTGPVAEWSEGESGSWS